MKKSHYRIRNEQLYEAGTTTSIWHHIVDPETSIFEVLKSGSLFVEATDRLRAGDMVILNRFTDVNRTELAERAQLIILNIDGIGVTWAPINHWHAFRARMSQAKQSNVSKPADAPMAEGDLRIKEVPAGFSYEPHDRMFVILDMNGATIELLHTEEEAKHYLTDPGLCPPWYAVIDDRGREVKRYPTRRHAADHIRRHEAEREVLAA